MEIKIKENHYHNFWNYTGITDNPAGSSDRTQKKPGKTGSSKEGRSESRKRPGASVSVRRRQTGNEIYIQLCLGPNPDNNAEEGDNIAAIQMTNCSDTYLASAKITVTVGDGTKLTYQVEALPAGKTVTAFEVQNQELPDKLSRKENRRKDTIFQRCISARRSTDDHRRRYEYWSY